ncbi:MAG: class I SAM-dependent methyltransferase [Verrucomicrobia bacterium]|nr:class I SAM-dependent methyltransferase [Verrucomicrobiota bacterium]
MSFSLSSELTSDGWQESSAAWLVEIGVQGDYGRQFVLDTPMLDRIKGRGFRTGLDIGCGEGRFCRMMQAEGICTVGIDPTEAFIRRARELDPQGDYRIDRAETFDVAVGSVDLVVSYLSLIDIPDIATAIPRMMRALRCGGTLLVANLTSFSTAGMPPGWKKGDDGEPRFFIDHYLDERSVVVSWRGIRIQNWHRPLSTYMKLFLESGLELRHFSEPTPSGGDFEKANRYRRVPYFHLMEWHKPAAGG